VLFSSCSAENELGFSGREIYNGLEECAVKVNFSSKIISGPKKSNKIKILTTGICASLKGKKSHRNLTRNKIYTRRLFEWLENALI
jgi:hypothetical protein